LPSGYKHISTSHIGQMESLDACCNFFLIGINAEKMAHDGTRSVLLM